MAGRPRQEFVLEVYFGGERIIGTSHVTTSRQVDKKIKKALNIGEDSEDTQVFFLVNKGEEDKFALKPMTGQYSLQPGNGGLVVRRLPIDWE